VSRAATLLVPDYANAEQQLTTPRVALQLKSLSSMERHGMTRSRSFVLPPQEARPDKHEPADTVQEAVEKVRSDALNGGQ
jgi:hypothetical protein